MIELPALLVLMMVIAPFVGLWGGYRHGRRDAIEQALAIIDRVVNDMESRKAHFDEFMAMVVGQAKKDMAHKDPEDAADASASGM